MSSFGIQFFDAQCRSSWLIDLVHKLGHRKQILAKVLGRHLQFVEKWQPADQPGEEGQNCIRKAGDGWAIRRIVASDAVEVFAVEHMDRNSKCEALTPLIGIVDICLDLLLNFTASFKTYCVRIFGGPPPRSLRTM